MSTYTSSRGQGPLLPTTQPTHVQQPSAPEIGYNQAHSGDQNTAYTTDANGNLPTSRSSGATLTGRQHNHPFPNTNNKRHSGSHNEHHQPRNQERSTNNEKLGFFAARMQNHHASVQDAYPNYSARNIKSHFVAMSGEFVGTFLFLWFAFAGTSFANNQPVANGSSLFGVYYIAVVFGLSLLANVWVFYRISGGLFNPAVTLGLAISGQVPAARAALLFPAQLLAGMVAAALADCMFPGPLAVTTRLTSETSVVQGLFIEMFLTSLLVITVLMLAAEKSKDTYLAPVGIGLAFFVAELAGIPYTGASLNPVRSFGPDVALRSFPGYHWIYWLGPLLGALVAAGYYQMAKFLNYTEANPGQDDTNDD